MSEDLLVEFFPQYRPIDVFLLLYFTGELLMTLTDPVHQLRVRLQPRPAPAAFKHYCCRLSV